VVQLSAKDLIANWEEMAYKFLIKYFPPLEAAKLRGDILLFNLIMKILKHGKDTRG